MARSRNRAAVPEAADALARFKYEVAEELGLRDDIEQRGQEAVAPHEPCHAPGTPVALR